MQDAIIKGNGNSRYLKTVAAALSLYPTYEDFLQAMIAGAFPIDLNGINTEGWTQQGTPLNKANLLPDATATSLGLPTTATVADALETLFSIPNGQGVLLVHCTDSSGDPVSGCVVIAGGITAVSNVFGYAKIELTPGSYSGTVRTPIDYGAVSSSLSGVVTAGKVTTVTKTVTDTLNGATQIDITTSMTAAFSGRVTKADAFGVGGGGSGGSGFAMNSSSIPLAAASGGAGGKTKTVSNIRLDVFVMTIGAGGASKTDSGAGNAGGTTAIALLSGTNLLSAAGGNGGSNVASATGYASCSGANGGSGSGGIRNTSVGASGSDGSDGGTATGTDGTTVSGGTGQGTTTRAFGEAGGELFASAGGSVCVYSSVVTGSVGAGGGAGVGSYNATTAVTVTGGTATTAGSGGGGAAINTKVSGLGATVKSGAGYRGLIRFRWEVA